MFRITSCSEAYTGWMFSSQLMTDKNTSIFGPDNTNYELHLRTGRPLGAADFFDQLEQLIGTSLRRKKGGWRKGNKRK
jgi:hypothetical protein